MNGMEKPAKIASNPREKALEALDQEKNEPIRWLLGRALKQHAEVSAAPHFLLDALAGTRTGTLVAWNADIEQYRAALENPELAPKKAEADLRSDGIDAEDKLRAVVAEIMAVITLSRAGYRQFRVLLPQESSTADFEAVDAAGKLVRIEVKNLREPDDIVRTVAVAHWKKRSAAKPGKYNFKAVLSHSHRGSLTASAKKRICSIIDSLPDARKPIDEVLDGGVHIRVEKAAQFASRVGQRDSFFLDMSGRDKPGILVVSGITSENLVTQISEVQSLFLKALRRVFESVPKFFGDTFTNEQPGINVMALRWEPPDFLVSEEMMQFVATKIENLFADFQLPLKVVIFVDPEIGWELIKRYS